MAGTDPNSQEHPEQTGTDQGGAQAALQAQADSLKAQIAQAQADLNQVDANGNPTDAALMAQSQLPKLQTQYIGLLENQASLEKTTQPKPASPKTVGASASQQYIAVQNPDGTIGSQVNPN